MLGGATWRWTRRPIMNAVSVTVAPATVFVGVADGPAVFVSVAGGEPVVGVG